MANTMIRDALGKDKYTNNILPEWSTSNKQPYGGWRSQGFITSLKDIYHPGIRRVSRTRFSRQHKVMIHSPKCKEQGYI
ncbi:predicted protein [Lichtheimia corymbifera JMRC:FSU:9682]|uniref:Uncharacterized protein n=1 Tax=Lichtheimia corymbifera JMRC:FSU:9682 TaxID=1263082 RepID=A0A068S4I4_9FUNG|nr:predicted protein [Lichtheimia corymbifera JMRC:FSU:9682]